MAERALLHGIYSDGQSRLGESRLYLFPFDILCEDISPPPRTFRVRGGSYRVYWPFKNGGGKGSELQQVAMASVPFLPRKRPERPEDRQLHGFTGTHRSGDETRPIADAIRVDCYPGDAPDMMGRLVPLLRWITRQWWVDRDRKHDEAYRRNSFNVDRAGAMVGGVAIMLRMAGRFNIEAPLDENRFWYAVESALAGKTAPLAALLYLDAIYYLNTNDLRRSILDASIACELLLLDHGGRMVDRGTTSVKQVRRSFKEAKLSYNLDRGLEETLGRSFAKELPGDFARIDRMWVARGNVAHGKPPYVSVGAGRRSMTHADQVEALKSVLKLFIWFQEQGYTLDPVAEAAT